MSFSWILSVFITLVIVIYTLLIVNEKDPICLKLQFNHDSRIYQINTLHFFFTIMVKPVIPLHLIIMHLCLLIESQYKWKRNTEYAGTSFALLGVYGYLKSAIKRIHAFHWK